MEVNIPKEYLEDLEYILIQTSQIHQNDLIIDVRKKHPNDIVFKEKLRKPNHLGSMVKINFLCKDSILICEGIVVRSFSMSNNRVNF